MTEKDLIAHFQKQIAEAESVVDVQRSKLDELLQEMQPYKQRERAIRQEIKKLNEPLAGLKFGLSDTIKATELKDEKIKRIVITTIIDEFGF